MAKPAIFLSAMPVLYVSGDFYDIARLKRLSRLSFFLIPTVAFNTNKHLAAAFAGVMNVPVVATCWLKGNVVNCQVIVRRSKGV